LLDNRKRTIKYHLTRERVKRWRRRQRYDLWVLGTHRAKLLGLARAEAARLTSEERTNLDEIFPGLI
jgi:hypothetical protein